MQKYLFFENENKIIECQCCKAIYELEDNDPDIIIEPFPHVECKQCGNYIALF